MTPHDLSGPEFDPPDCPAWAKEDWPAWLTPHRGINGLPARWHEGPGEPLVRGVRGIDRHQANQFIYYNPAAAECHDRGPGQGRYAEAKVATLAKLLRQSDAELGFTEAGIATKWRAEAGGLTVDELARREVGFGVINHPLPNL
jgi:hypothetical protein